MSQVIKKFIGDDEVGAYQILLENNVHLRGRNAANDLDIDILKVNASDVPEFAVQPEFGGSQLATESYVDAEIAAIVNPTWAREAKTLAGGDITNQYVDLAEEIIDASLDVVVSGLVQRPTLDYTLSVVGGVTRVTFAGDLATGGPAALVAGDVMYFKYQY